MLLIISPTKNVKKNYVALKAVQFNTNLTHIINLEPVINL